jgi:signal transduction histidine kinase
MWPTGYLLRQGKAGRPPSTSAGPAMTTLRSVITYLAALIRSLAAAYVVIQVFIWHSFFTANPWRLAAPLAAVAWAVVAVLYLRHRYLRRGWPAWQAACLDTAVYVTLALSAEACVPPAIRGEAANWLVIAMAAQLVVPAWFVPAWLSVPVGLAGPVAYWIGVAGVPSGSAGVNSPAAAGAVLVVCVAIHWCGRRMLYRGASRADAGLARADQDAREQYVILSRNVERREQARLVHDTVLNTLTAISRAGPGDHAEIVRRCRHDLTMLESALSDHGAPDADAASPYDDLLGGLETVAAEMRGRGLQVHTEVADAVPAAVRARAVPAAVATALVRAAREALANVADHAGTAEAWLQVSLSSPGDQDAPDGLRVLVRDEGRGFDPDRIGPARLGVRRSVIERIRDGGGDASIQSEPGHGTVVSLHWPWSAQSGPAQPGAAQSGPAQPEPVQSGPTQPGPAQSGPAQPKSAQPGPAQPRPAQPSGPPALAGGAPGQGSPPW